jgi:hypothetical protein
LGAIVKICPFLTCGKVVSMFRSLISEARSLVGKQKRKKKDLEERPELSVSNDPSFPRRGIEKTQFGPGTTHRTGIGGGGTRP